MFILKRTLAPTKLTEARGIIFQNGKAAKNLHCLHSDCGNTAH